MLAGAGFGCVDGQAGPYKGGGAWVKAWTLMNMKTLFACIR